jgi:GNAT superfamily N-acetyltransferase
MPEAILAPADSVEPGILHAAVVASFADYLIGPFAIPFNAWPSFLGGQGVDLHESRVALAGGVVQAFALLAPRAGLGVWRLAVMGALPAARGSGLAPQLLDDLLRRAVDAGVRDAELECFAQNERALRLYRSRGFAPLHELHGYARAAGLPLPADAGNDDTAVPVGLADAFAWLDAVALRRGDLPLQVTGVSLRARTVALQAWRRGAAQLVFTGNGEGAVTIQSLIDTQERQADAQSLVAQLVRRFSTSRIGVPQLQRADLGGDALLRLGFERLSLHQCLMRKPLASRS